LNVGVKKREPISQHIAACARGRKGKIPKIPRREVKFMKGQINVTVKQAYLIFCALHSYNGMATVTRQVKNFLNERFDKNPKLRRKYPGVGR
jgi:protein involved in ribonucleotide reduction